MIQPSTWAVPSMGILKGLFFASTLVAMDLAFANISISLLTIAIQQCVIATNPAFVVTIESIFHKKLFHPAIYGLMVVLCLGPLVADIGTSMDDAPLAGV